MIDGTTPNVSLPVLNPKKRARRRWTVLIIVQILILLHIALWLLGKEFGWFAGKTLSPIEPSEGMEFVKYGVINAGAIFFALALLSTFLFGRWFCGWGCHIVLLQDVCLWLLKKIHIRPKPFRARLLMWFPFFLATYMYIWPLYDRFVNRPDLKWPGISTHVLTTDYWGSFVSPIVAIPFLLICGFATVYVLGAKGFCTYGCPYGGFFKPLDAISPMRVRVNDHCQQCGKCTAACTSNVRVHEEVNLYKMVIDSGCMKTSDCIDACPNDALHIGFGSIAIGKRTKPRKYDLTLVEELSVWSLFLVGFFAFRGLYALVPMLMAVGMSLVSTWVIWKGFTVLQKPNVSFHKTQLKFHNKLQRAGVLFLIVSCMLALFTAQSVAITWFRYAGDRALVDNNIEEALRYYKLSGPMSDGGVGFASNPNVDVSMSKIHEQLGSYQTAERLLWRVDGRVGPSEQATMLLGQIMQYHQQFEVINGFYVSRLEALPQSTLVWEDYVGWLKRDGLYTRALIASKNAVVLNPTATRLRIQLLLLEIEFGDVEHGISIARILVDEFPDDPSIWKLLSRALHRAGQPEEAIEAFQKAATLPVKE